MISGYCHDLPPAGGWLDLGPSEEHLQWHSGGANPRSAELHGREDSDLATRRGGDAVPQKRDQRITENEY